MSSARQQKRSPTPQICCKRRRQAWLILSLVASSPLLAADNNTPPLPEVSAGQLLRLPQIASAYVPSRPIDVWLPEGYSSAQRYAVLYMHDGQMLFDARTTWNGQSWQVAETAQQLQQQGQVRPFIVVGIHNIGAARHSEYFPQHHPSEGRIHVRIP